MSDLVELLRNEALNGLGCPSLYSDAADEIERLRSALAAANSAAEYFAIRLENVEKDRRKEQKP